MIITDTSTRPSDRFIQIVQPYFVEQGYVFKSGKKIFVRPFDKGFHQVGFWFRISTLTDVTLHWGFRLEKLEKVCAEITGRNKKSKTDLTLGADLPNYTRRQKNIEMPIPLYDNISLKYDDFSINNAAKKTIHNYEEYVVPYFAKYTDYFNLEKLYNDSKFKQTNGLILAKYFSLPNFNELASTLHTQIKLRCLKDDCEELIAFNKTLDFLSKNDIKNLLD